MKSQIRKPAILASGLLFVNNDGAYIGINNETYKILTEIVSFEAGFNVTLLDDTGATVKNQQVTCTTNSQQYTTDSSGKIPETIYYEGTSLTFTWSTTSTGWTSVSGILQQNQTTTSNYTAVVNGGVIGKVLNLTSNNATVQTSTSGSSYRINAAATVGNTITIGDDAYIITHVTSSIVYVALKYWQEDTVYDSGNSNVYSGSDVANKCRSWYNSIPSSWRTSANAFTSVYTSGVSAVCFIPTKNQVDDGWSYFNSNSRRVFTSSSGTEYGWWTSTADSDSVRRVWIVNSDGSLVSSIGVSPGNLRGFRPALALKRSLFTS